MRLTPPEPWSALAGRAATVLLGMALPLTLSGCRGQPVRRPQPLAVRVEPVSAYPFPEQVQTISTLEAPEEVNLAAQADGRIQSLLIRQGIR